MWLTPFGPGFPKVLKVQILAVTGQVEMGSNIHKLQFERHQNNEIKDKSWNFEF